MAADYTAGFTTAGLVDDAPTVTATTPADTATGVDFSLERHRDLQRGRERHRLVLRDLLHVERRAPVRPERRPDVLHAQPEYRLLRGRALHRPGRRSAGLRPGHERSARHHGGRLRLHLRHDRRDPDRHGSGSVSDATDGATHRSPYAPTPRARIRVRRTRPVRRSSFEASSTRRRSRVRRPAPRSTSFPPAECQPDRRGPEHVQRHLRLHGRLHRPDRGLRPGGRRRGRHLRARHGVLLPDPALERPARPARPFGRRDRPGSRSVRREPARRQRGRGALLGAPRGMRGRLPTGSITVGRRRVFGPETTMDGEDTFINPTHPVALRANPYARRTYRDPHPQDNNPALFDDNNGFRIIVASLGVKAASNDNTTLIAPTRTYDTVTNAPAGGVYFSFGKYVLQTVEQPVVAAGPDPYLNAPPTAPLRPQEYSMGDYNVENLYDYRDDPFDGCDFAGNPAARASAHPSTTCPRASSSTRQGFGRSQPRSSTTSTPLRSSSIQEAEDQDICTSSGSALSCGTTNNADGRPDTLQELALAIAARGGPTYQAASDRDGADARGITAAIMYRTDRVELLPAPGGDPVLGAAPTVSYRGTPLAYNTQTQNPKVLNAVLPPTSTARRAPTATTSTRVPRRSGSSGSGSSPAARELLRPLRRLRALRSTPDARVGAAARAGLLQRGDRGRDRGRTAGHAHPHRRRLQRLPATGRPVPARSRAVPERPDRRALRPGAPEPLGRDGRRGAGQRVLVRLRLAGADTRPALRVPLPAERPAPGADGARERRLPDRVRQPRSPRPLRTTIRASRASPLRHRRPISRSRRRRAPTRSGRARS